MAMHSQYEICVIGSGNAAEGIVHGLLRKMVLLDDRIVATDPDPARRQVFADRFKIDVTGDNRAAVQNSYIVLLAVKPQVFGAVCAGFADLIREDQVVVSIMAGVPTASIEGQFPDRNVRVVRVMPNLAMHVGEGMAGICAGKHATEADVLRTQRIFEAGGRAVVLADEALMDAVTAVSGTGPAYFYYFCEAIVEAGEQAGLTHQQAAMLATQTCLGAASMMIQSQDPPAVLRKKVMSPGGTTEAAVENMQSTNVKQAIIDSVLAAWQRSKDLGHPG